MRFLDLSKIMKSKIFGPLLLVVISISAIAFATYMWSAKYDWPFRIQSRYDKYAYGGSFVGYGLSVSPDSTAIVYGSPRTGRGDIYIVDTNGKGTKRLTYDNDYEGNPCFSPDGRQIAFEHETDKCGHIWLMNRDGSNARQLTFGSSYDSNPVFSSNGRSVWFMRVPQGTNQVAEYEIDITGHNQTSSRLPGFDPTFCPKSELVFYVNTPDNFRYNIRCMDLRTGKDRLVGEGVTLSVSPDGKSLVFLPRQYDQELWVMDTYGGHRRKVFSTDGFIVSAVYSPDARYIYFSQEGGEGQRSMRDIYRIKPDGSDKTFITSMQ